MDKWRTKVLGTCRFNFDQQKSNVECVLENWRMCLENLRKNLGKKVPKKGQRDDSQLKNWILVTDNWSDDRQNKKVSCESQQKKCDTTEELKETLTNRIDFNASKRRSNEVLFCCDYCKNERPAFGMKKYPKEKKIKEEQLEKLVQRTKCYLWITRIINEKTGRLGKKNFSEK